MPALSGERGGPTDATGGAEIEQIGNIGRGYDAIGILQDQHGVVVTLGRPQVAGYQERARSEIGIILADKDPGANPEDIVCIHLRRAVDIRAAERAAAGVLDIGSVRRVTHGRRRGPGPGQ